MQVVIQTRFSFFGQSGWRSEASQNPEILFDPARLETRLRFFEHIALASLQHQTDPNFRIAVLSSTLMPDPFQTRLSELCHDVIGPRRADVMFRQPGSAGANFRRHVHNRCTATPHVAQVVLDDDDALSADFVEVCRAESTAAMALNRGKHDYCFLSFPKGASMELDNQTARLSGREVPMTNLGLTLVAPNRTKRNPFMTAHKRLTRRHPVRMIYGPDPYYIRTVHGFNDSRAITQESELTSAGTANLFERFPFLREKLNSELAPNYTEPAAEKPAEKPAARNVA